MSLKRYEFEMDWLIDLIEEKEKCTEALQVAINERTHLLNELDRLRTLIPSPQYTPKYSQSIEMTPWIGTPLSYGQVDGEIRSILKDTKREVSTCHVALKPLGIVDCNDIFIHDLYDISACKKDYIIGILRVHVSDLNCAAHANALWFDLIHKKIYRFDSLFAKYKQNTAHVLNVLQRIFANFDIVDVSTLSTTTLGPQAKYNKNSLIAYLKKCEVDKAILQKIEEGIDGKKLRSGMCMAWSLLFLRKLVVNNFDVKATIHELVVSNGHNDNLIRKYSVHVARKFKHLKTECYNETVQNCNEFGKIQDYHLAINDVLVERNYNCFGLDDV